MQWIRSIFRSTRRLAGTDLDGNKYYEIIREGKKARREVMMKNKLKHGEYQAGLVPILWESWLRGSVRHPPTHEDLIKEQQRQLGLSRRVVEINERDKRLQQKEYDEGLVSRPVGHASSRFHGDVKDSTHGQTTGKDFRPGVWEKQLEQENVNEDKFEPESWKPP